MDFLEWAKGRKLPSALQSRKGWAQLFEHYRSEEPHLHQIEPTNCCRYTCVMCPRSSSMTRRIGNMDIELFKKVIDEVSTYQSVTRDKEIELFHFGESLFHPKLADFVAYTHKAKLRAVLSINPADLGSSMIAKLLDAKPYKIIVSLDSMKAERLSQIRGKRADLEASIANTKKLLIEHKRQGASTQIIVRMIEMNINADETDSFRQYWQEQGAHVEIREFFPWSKPELEALGEQVKYPPFMPCPFPWQYLVVQWNGDVVACCRDYNGQIVLGNVANQSLKDIWNGDNYRQLRENMVSGKNLKSFCQDCLSIYYTES